MFVGHYAFGYYLKARYRDVPLWTLFLAVQFVDLLWALAIFFGIERASFNPEESSVFLRAVYEYYPYTHSLFTSATIALLVSFVVYKSVNARWALVLGVAIVSHWFLDVIVHVPDVPLFFDSYKIGFGLWHYPVLTLIVEMLLLTAGLWYFLRSETDTRTRKWACGIYAFLAVFYAGSFFAPAIPPTTTQVGIFGLLIYGGIPLLVYVAERRKRTQLVLNHTTLDS